MLGSQGSTLARFARGADEASAATLSFLDARSARLLVRWLCAGAL